jgi:hypothetical protein
MADFASSFAPEPCSYLANTGGTNILLVKESQCGCLTAKGCKRKKSRCRSCR